MCNCSSEGRCVSQLPQNDQDTTRAIPESAQRTDQLPLSTAVVTGVRHLLSSTISAESRGRSATTLSPKWLKNKNVIDSDFHFTAQNCFIRSSCVCRIDQWPFNSQLQLDGDYLLRTSCSSEGPGCPRSSSEHLPFCIRLQGDPSV